MRMLLIAWLALICVARMDAANIVINGTLTWKVVKPDCIFKLDGAIQNLGPGASGTLKLVLWATPGPFPSRGYSLAEYNLGSLPAGYQFNDFSHKIAANIPKIDGKYYFSVSVLEFTNSGWLNRAYVTTGTKLLNQGEFVTGYKWPFPARPVIAPPPKLTVGAKLRLTVRADGNLNGIVQGTWAKTTVTMKKNGSTTVIISGDESDWRRIYTVGKSTLVNTKVPVGKLRLSPEGSSGASTITLFFQSSTSGVYKHVQTSPRINATTWGTFSYKTSN